MRFVGPSPDIRPECQIEEARRYARGNEPGIAPPVSSCGPGPVRPTDVMGTPAYRKLTKTPSPPRIATFNLCQRHRRDPLIRVAKVRPVSADIE